MPVVGAAATPTHEDVRNAILRTIDYAFRRRGLTANTLPGSDHYIRADAYARRVSVAIANYQLALTDISPLRAVGDALTELASVFGVERRAASKASGFAQIFTTPTTATVTIPSGFKLKGPTGELYETTGTSIGIANQAYVAVQSVNTGSGTNQAAVTAAGAVVQMQWLSSSVGRLNPIAWLDAGGITGGRDEDDDETLRARLIDRLSFPKAGGNSAYIRSLAEDSTSAIEKAYVYPAVRGAGSYDVALTKAGGNRVVSAENIAIAKNAILAEMPGIVSLNTTSVASTEVDVVVKLTLPNPITAGGAGGGWRDASPWPGGTFAAGSNDGKVTAYVTATDTATVRTTSTPVVGQRIAIWSPISVDPEDDNSLGIFKELTIETVGGSSGAYTITVVGGFSGNLTNPAGAYVSPGAFKIVEYGRAVKQKIALLGPGEKTTNVDILPRGRRNPGPEISNPSDLSSRIIDTLTTNYGEVGGAEYQARFATGTTTTTTAPGVPTTTADPPKILALKYLAFRKE